MTTTETMKLALDALESNMGEYRIEGAATILRTAIEQAEKQEPVAWDVFELRLYGAPQEKQHRVLWVDRYTRPDGSTPDLDGLLEAAKEDGGIDGGAKTLYVRPLYTTPPAQPAQQEQLLALIDENQRLRAELKFNTAAAQRQWVGLTDAEIDEWTPEIHSVIQAIEAKLKEKNT